MHFCSLFEEKYRQNFDFIKIFRVKLSKFKGSFMCCFGVRVFLLFFITILSFVLNRFYPQIPVVFYYLVLANILAFLMFILFFKDKLPSFVKPKTIHYFSLIGGVVGAFLAMAICSKFKRDEFTFIELILFAIWLCFVAVLIFKFKEVSAFFGSFVA